MSTNENSSSFGFEGLTSDPEAWARTTRSLRRIALVIVRDDAAADDVVQGVWLEALQQRPFSFGIGWLKRLVQRRAIDDVRRRTRQGDLAARAAQHDAEDEVGSELEIHRRVVEAVDALAEPYRSTVYLRYFEGLSASAIALRLKLPEKTVKTRLTRAHAKLRDRLGSRFQAEGGEWSPALLGFAGAKQGSLVGPLTLTLHAFVMNKVVVAVVALLLASLAWIMWPDGRESSTQTRASEVAESVEDSAIDLLAVEEAAPELARSEREAVDPGGDLEVDTPELAAASGSLRVSVSDSNGSPAIDVSVVVELSATGRQMGRRFRRTTSEDGEAWFPKLPEGTVRVRTDRGGKSGVHKAEIELGGETQLGIDLTPGVRVSGFVHDRDDRPIVDANIWLTSETGGWTAGATVTRSDGEGRFVLDDVPSGQSIGALASGFMPSHLVDLDTLDTASGEAEIDLAMSPGGCRLVVLVRDEEGAPLQAATVVLGDMSQDAQWRLDGTRAEVWSPIAGTTDQDGRLVLEGLAPGEHALNARDLEHPDWLGRVELKANRSTEIEIQLLKGATVRGQVSDEDGRPIAGAGVYVSLEELDDSHLQSGQIDYYGAFALRAVPTDSQGRYELSGLSSGEVFIYAQEMRADVFDRGTPTRYAVSRLELSPGAEVTWDCVLGDGRSIVGKAEYSDGTPIIESFVILTEVGGEGRRAVYSAAGEFKFIQLEAVPHTVRVQMWELPEGHAEPSLTDVLPDTGPLRVVATFEPPLEIEPATVTMRFIDESERLSTSPEVRIREVDGSSGASGSVDGDVWTFELEDPGHYRVVVLEGERRIASSAIFEIQGGETLDLGQIVSEPACSLLMRIESSLEYPPLEVRGLLRHDDFRWGESLDLGGRSEIRIDNLEPGKCNFGLVGANIVRVEVPFELRRGEETVLDVSLVPAVPVSYHIDWTPEEAAQSLEIRFFDREDGTLVTDASIKDLLRMTSPIEWSVALPLGAYRFELDFGSSPDYSEDFDVHSLEKSEAPKLRRD